jgi:ankyrin repeat protein
MNIWRPGWKAALIAAVLAGLAGEVLPAGALTGFDPIQAAVSRRDPFGRFRKNVTSLIQKGRRALQRGQLNEAAGYFRRALDMDPGNKSARAGMRRVEAIRSARRAEAAKRRQEEDQRRRIAEILTRADASLAAGRPLAARADYRRVLTLDPANKAARAGLVRVRRALLDRPVSQEVKTAVFRAAHAGDRAALDKILDEYPGASRVVNKNGETPLHVCAQLGHAVAARRLIQVGARVNARDKWGYTPLHKAAFSGLVSVTAQLLARGARVSAKDQWGNTPLHVAAVQGQIGVASLLLRAGARPSARDKKGDSPLHKASATDQWPMAALLLARGANVNARNERQWTPLHMTAYFGRPLTARLLLDRGAKLDATDSYGRTAYALANRLCRGNKRARDCTGIMDLLSSRGLTR